MVVDRRLDPLRAKLLSPLRRYLPNQMVQTEPNNSSAGKGASAGGGQPLSTPPKTRMPYRKSGITRFIWPLICVAVLQAVLIVVSLETLSSLRAYVNGESLWTKGFKDAVFFLDRYTETRDERFFRRYRDALELPLGDRRARLTLERPRYDYDIAFAGFRAGGNHPEDVVREIWMFRWFQDVSYMKNAVHHWRLTDKDLMRLSALGDDIRATLSRSEASPVRIAQWRQEIREINESLTPLAWAFSNSLSEASRKITQLLIGVNIGAGLLLIFFGLWGTRKLLRQRQLAERALAREQRRALAILASIGDAVVTIDRDGRVDYMNPAAEKLTNRTCDEVDGVPLGTVFALVDEHSNGDRLNIAKELLHGRSEEVLSNTQLERSDGSRVTVSLVGTPLRDEDAEDGAVLVFHDMTRERQYVANLSWQATHDTLTGLHNRREFDRRLSRLLERLEELGGNHALLYVDLDQFKIVNDTCGHEVGDQLLCQAAAHLQQCLREGDTLARLGGDEFGILLENCHAEPALHIAEKLRQVIEDVHFVSDQRKFTIGASIGLVCLTPLQFSLAEALRAADMACYLAKEKGRNRVQMYRAEDAELSSRFGEMIWVQQIQEALSEQRFCLYAQDIASRGTPTDAGVHVELLLRLRDRNGEIVLPGEFLPAAERYGLMPQLDRWVVANAFASLAERQRLGAPVAHCAINLSGATIGDESFLGFLREQFHKYAVQPESICFEVMETVAVANFEKAVRFIPELQHLGCRFALDDFGAGMSSFSYLKHLPVDLLKIDGGFIKDMLADPVDSAMVEMISRLAHMMGKKTVAEFVETKEILNALAPMGVDFVQGHAIAKPQPFYMPTILSDNNHPG